MRKQILLALLFITGFTAVGFSQLQSYSFSAIDSLRISDEQPTVVFIFTDWCKYCHVMKQTTFQNDEVIRLLNEKFRYGQLNAEENNDILFNGYRFTFKPTGAGTGIHELAEQLATIDGQVSFPTLCILNSDNEIIFQYNQFLRAGELVKVLEAVLKEI